MLHAGKQIMWWKNFFTKISLDLKHLIILHGNNTQIIQILKFKLGRTSTKLLHINVA